MTTTVDIWSDIHCPWAYVAVHRLRRARDAHDLDVVFAPRAWPLEWVNGRGTPRDIVTTETAALASHEPELFTAYTGESWPSTFLPAFELVVTVRRRYGVRAAEDVDFALRLAFFRDGVDVSIRAGLHHALVIATGLNADVVLAEVEDDWLNTNVAKSYADAVSDFKTANEKEQQLENRFEYGGKLSLISQDEFTKTINSGGGWDTFKKNHPGVSGIVTFSAVGFSRDGSHAVVNLSYLCYSHCGNGTFCILEKKNGEWIIAQQIGTWIS